MKNRIDNQIHEIFNKTKSERFQSNLSSILCFLCFLVVMLVSLKGFYPINRMIVGDDSEYHYLRTEALYERLKSNDFFNGGIDYLFCNGAGYASSTAYPDLFLYIPAVLRLLGISLPASMYIFIFICSAAGYLNMFILVKQISGSTVGGSAAGIIYTLSFYRLDNIYVRFALGEIEAYVFWPVVLLGLYDFIIKDFKKPYILGIGLAGMMMSHLISAVEALGICILLSIIFIPRIIRNPKKLIMLAITAVCMLAVTAYFWIPLIEFLLSGEFVVSYPLWKSENCTVKFLDMFKDSKITGTGILLFVLWIPRVLINRNSPVYQELAEKSENKEKKPDLLLWADVCMVLGLIVCFIVSDKAPWKVLRYPLNFMQFPWRMYAPAGTLIIFSGAVYISIVLKYTNGQKKGLLAVLAVSVLAAAVHMEPVEVFRSSIDDSYFQNENTFTVGVGEWYPVEAKKHMEMVYQFSDKVIADDGTEILFERNNGTLTFKPDADTCQYADIPYIYYKGYKIRDSKGKELPVEMNDFGMVRVYLSEASEGIITVKHTLTAARSAAYIISAVSAAGLIVFVINRRLSLRKKNRC